MFVVYSVSSCRLEMQKLDDAKQLHGWCQGTAPVSSHAAVQPEYVEGQLCTAAE